jgi:hypothetical protein
MHALGFVQRCLGYRRRLLTPFAIPPPGSPLAPDLGLTALLLLLEIGGGLSGVPFADLRSCALRRLCPAPFASLPILTGPQVGGKIGVLCETPVDPAGRLRTTPGFVMVAAATSGSLVSFATP